MRTCICAHDVTLFRQRATAALRAHFWRCCLVELSMRACAPLRPILLKNRTVKTMLGAARTYCARRGVAIYQNR